MSCQGSPSARAPAQMQQRNTRYGESERTGISLNTVCRIKSLNIETFPRQESDVKMDLLRSWTIDSEASIIFLQELNYNYSNIHPAQRPDALMQGWFQNMHVNYTWMRKGAEIGVARQYGGVALLTLGPLVSTICASGRDERGYARWVWTTYRGRNQHHTTAICIYYPHRNQARSGSVDMQQSTQLALDFPGEQRETHQQFRSDLREFIQLKISQGHHIIVGGDFNQDLRQWNSPLVYMLNQLGLTESIINKYGGDPPTTFERGHRPIDGIFTTSGLTSTHGGYNEFLPGLSPHSSIYVDIPYDQIIGAAGVTVTRPRGRRLQKTIPRIANKWNMINDSECIRTKLDEKTTRLLETVITTKTLTKSQQQLYEQYCALQRRNFTIADKNCVKVRRGQVAFSPEVHDAMGAVVCWKLIIRRESLRNRPNRPHYRLLQRRLRRWNFTEEWRDLSLDEMKEKQYQAKRRYRTLKPLASAKREEFYHQLAMDRAMDDGGKFESHLKQIIHQEQNKKMHQRIKRATKSNIGGAVSYIEEVQPDGTRIQIHDQEGMEARIRFANEAKLQQANNTPLRMEPLSTFFGEHGDYERWEEVLTGTRQIPAAWDVERGTRLYMQEMSRNKAPDTPLNLTEKEYNRSWKIKKEKTSCAPPTHFGHYMTPLEKSPGSVVNSNLGLIPLVTGYSPDKWKECVNTMLIKKINDLTPAKLRLITLMHPQFNHANTMVGRVARSNMEKYGQLEIEQYGSRNHRNSRTHCLNKRLLLDILLALRRTFVLIANDAKSCYDRILMIMAYLILRRGGIEKEPCISIIHCMLWMRHFIRTMWGDSDDYYGGEKWDRRPHGNGQGNGDGPTLWAGISSVCIKILKQHGYGIEVIACISEASLLLAGFAFVDDTDLVQDGSTVGEAMARGQECLILWEELIRATGGAIEPTKSDWVLIQQKWQRGKWRIQKRQDSLQLSVRNPAGTIERLQQLKPTEARETLGIWQAPDGSEERQTRELVSKVSKWCNGIQAMCLPSKDVSLAIKTSVVPKITYSLLATSFSESQCKRIIDPVIQRVVPKMRLARTTNRLLLHAPTRLLGIGIPNPHVHQAIEHAKVLADYGGKSHETGLLINNMIETQCLALGVTGQISTWPMTQLKHVMEGSWLKTSLVDMAQYGIGIRSDHAELQLWRENDRSIMDCALARSIGAGGFTTSELTSINKCRNYLQICTLADISDGTGKHIMKWAYDCHSPNPQSMSYQAYSWPPQGKPSTRNIWDWQQFLQSLTTRGPLLRQYLGCWKPHAQKWAQWLYHEGQERLYQRDDNVWKVWSKTIRRRTRRPAFILRPDLTYDQRDIDSATIACVTLHRTRAFLYGYADFEPQTPLEAPEDFVEMTKDDGWVLADMEIVEGSEATIIAMLRDGTAMMTTDGSTRDHQSASGILLFTHNDEDLWQGGNYVPGRPNDQTSYRSELGGVLGGVKTMNNFCACHGITDGKITLGVDSDSALDKAFEEGDVPSSWACYDILRLIRAALAESPLIWVPKKVEGHQDKDKPYASLDVWGRANVRVDRIAKRFWAQHPGNDLVSKSVQGQGWTLTIHDQEITSHIIRDLYYEAIAPRIKKYWAKKTYIIHPEDSDNEEDVNKIDWVDWEGLGKMTEYMEDHICRWITKHMAHISPTNETLFRRGERPTDRCPFCDETETSEHVFTCHSEHTTAVYKAEMIKVREWLDRNSAWDTRDAIIEILEAIRQGRAPILRPTWCFEVQTAFESQRRLSMLAFTCGLFHTDWRKAVQQYKEKHKRKFSLPSWMGLLGQKIWMMKWNIWRSRTSKVHRDEDIQEKVLAGDGIDEAIDEFFDMVPTITIHMNRTQAKIFGADKNRIKQYRVKKKMQWLKRAMAHLQSYEEYIATQQRSLTATRFRQHLGIGPTYQVQITRPPPHTEHDYHQQQLHEWRLPHQGQQTRYHRPQSRTTQPEQTLPTAVPAPTSEPTSATEHTTETATASQENNSTQNTQITSQNQEHDTYMEQSQDQFNLHTPFTYPHSADRAESHQLTLTQWLEGQGHTNEE